jgi:hypothetical protein
MPVRGHVLARRRRCTVQGYGSSGRTFASLNRFRHLHVCDDTRTDVHEALLSLGVRADLLPVSAKQLEQGLPG